MRAGVDPDEVFDVLLERAQIRVARQRHRPAHRHFGAWSALTAVPSMVGSLLLLLALFD